jgi:hypothetical protein
MQGTVTCGSWIRRPENLNLVVLGKSSKKRESASRSVLEIFSFDPQTASLSNSPQVCSSNTVKDAKWRPFSVFQILGINGLVSMKT